MKKLLIVLLLTAFSSFLFAQSHRVTGTVIDASNSEPLIGVSVTVVGTTTGTMTDMDGRYLLSVPNEGTLRVSYLGYKPQEFKIASEQTIDVKLEQDSEMLDEVVLVGYTVQKKRDVLGAVSKVEGGDLLKTPVASPQQALQGRVAGVNVTSQTGAPGAAISVNIRGIGSISGSNEPLYVIDGVPTETGLNNISANDIEEITILKEAASSAIYGSRATNGVVLVTTKQGKSGEAKIEFNAQFGVQTHMRLTPMANTSQYIEIYNEAARTDNLTNPVPRTLIEGAYLKDFADVNHLEEIFQTAPLQSYDLSISGGNDKTRYLFSLGYYDQEGIIKNTDFSKVTFRSNVTSDVKKWLQVGLNTSGSFSDQKTVSSSGDGYAGGGGSVVRYALYRNPAIPVYNANGNFVDLPSSYYGDALYNSFFGDGYNPVGMLEYNDNTEKMKSFFVSANALLKLPKDIMLRTVYGIDYKSTDYRIFNSTWGTNDRINSMNSLDMNNQSMFNWTLNSVLSQSFSMDEKHNFSWMVGTEAISNHERVIGGSESDYGDLHVLGYGNVKPLPYQTESESRLLSFFASLYYNFNQKYYLSALIREDGSSKFSDGNRWGTFYSFGAGWNIESEDWMQQFNNLSKLKLRAGYGAIGNQNIDNNARFSTYNYGYYYTFGGTSLNGFSLNSLGNEDLKWETSRQFNAGLDLELWAGSFGATIDYYYKITDDMLVPEQLPLSSGTQVQYRWVNNGNILNTGIDLELFYRKNFKNGGFNITWNGGYLYNEVLSLKNPRTLGRVDTGVYVKQVTEGQSLGAFYLYEMDGIFQNDVEIYSSAYQGANIKPGDVKYKDNFEDGVIDEKDRTFIGTSIPKFTTGLNLAGNYKNFDASMFFQGAFGHSIYSQINQDLEGFYRGFNVTERYYNERWTGEGTSNTQPRASWSAKSNNARSGSSRFLEDASYLRLKNVQIGYTIPNTKKFHIDNLRVYVSANNVFTLTKFSLDPEMTTSQNAAGEGDGAAGIDWGTYPQARSFTFGLNLTF